MRDCEALEGVSAPEKVNPSQVAVERGSEDWSCPYVGVRIRQETEIRMFP
jgi:hypothetical protein